MNVIRGTEDCRRKAGSELSDAKNDMMGKTPQSLAKAERRCKVTDVTKHGGEDRRLFGNRAAQYERT